MFSISTVRSCLEERIKMRVPVTHCLFGWLMEHAAWLLTTRRRQSDGLTPHQRLRGRAFGTAMLCFGERCHYKLPKLKHERALERKLGSKWTEALFLGYSRDSNEYLVWSIEDQSLVRANSLQRKPSVGRLSSEELMRVNLRPQDALYRSAAEPTGRREPSQGFEDRVAPEDKLAPTRARSVHDFSVVRKDLEQFGYTEVGCPRRLHEHTRTRQRVCHCTLQDLQEPHQEGPRRNCRWA